MRNKTKITLTLLILLSLISLNAFAQDKSYMEIAGHTDDVLSAVFSPDGNTIASGSGDATIRLWNAKTGKLLKTLTGHTDSVLSVVFSPDGNTIASGSGDATIRLWNAKTGKLLKTLTGHASFVLSVAFSPDGNTLASGGYDSTIRLWNAKAGKLLKTLEGHTLGGHTFPVWSVAFSPDGNTLASGGGVIRLWNAKAGKLLKTLTEHASFVFSVAFSPDGNTIACGGGGSDTPICLWNAKTGKLLKTLAGHTHDVWSVAFSPDGNTLASGSEDDTIRLWNVKTGKLLKTLEGHTHDIRSVAFSPDGNTLASGSEDNTIRLWHVDTAEPTPNEPKPTPNEPIRTTVSLSKSSGIVAPGKAFTLHATLEHIGGASAPSTLQFYGPVKVVRTIQQATSGTLPTIDFTGKTLGEPIAIAAMDAGSTLKETITATALETAGAYAYKACIQRTNDAAGTGEICSDVFTVTVSPPDLQFAKVWAEPATVAPGAVFKLYATVSNPGGKSDKTALWFYRQDEDTKSGTELGGNQIDPLPLSDGKTEVTKSITVTAPETPGHYIYSASVDDVDGEAKSINNYNEVTITVGGPDVVIDSIWATRNEKVIKEVEINNHFNLHVIVKNKGNAKSEKTTLRYYRAINENVSKSDVELYETDVAGNYNADHKSHSVPALEPGGEVEMFLDTHAPPKVSNYYYRAEVADVLFEIDKDNNWSEVFPITYATDLWPGFISQVAHSPDGYTYFVVDPPAFVNVPGLSLMVFDVKTCSVTLHTPDSGYFMFPLDSPQGTVLDTVDKVDTGVNLVLSIIGVLPDGLVKKASWLETLTEKVKGVFDGILGTVLSVIQIFGGLVDIAIDVVNPDDPRDPPTLTIKPSDGFWTAFRNHFVDELLDLENYEYKPFLPPTLFVIREPLASIDITVKQEYVLKNDETKHLYTFEYTRTWNLKESTGAAPSARPMSIADYAPFQQLPPEAQAYLQQFLEAPDFWQTVMIAEAQKAPETTSLLPNYPNPFNPETWIPYQLAQPADVTLTIYDIHGRVVRGLDLGHQRAGMYHGRSRAAYWDGRNAVGEPVASGVYFYTLTAGEFTATRKMLIKK